MKGNFFASAAAVALLAAAFGAAELHLRRIRRPGPGPARFLFLSELNQSRWDYLDAEGITVAEEVRLDEMKPHQDYVAGPEPGRPPFDRVPTRFRVRTNSHGFRDKEFRLLKRPGVKRVFLLGDSVAWGKGVAADERFGDLLAKSLGARVEILNLAAQGCTTHCMALFLERFLEYQPDLVVLQASSNDLDLAVWRRTSEALGPRLVRAIHALRARSRLLLYLSYAAAGNPTPAHWLDWERGAQEDYGDDLARLFAVCERRGMPVVLLQFPLADGRRFTAYVERACRARPKVCREAVRADLEHPARWIGPGLDVEASRGEDDFVAKTAKQMGVAVEALDPVLPYRRYFFDIVHPNALANRIVARQLEEVLLRPSTWSR